MNSRHIFLFVIWIVAPPKNWKPIIVDTLTVLVSIEDSIPDRQLNNNYASAFQRIAQFKLFKQTTILWSSENIEGFKIYKKVKGKRNKIQTQDKRRA